MLPRLPLAALLACAVVSTGCTSSGGLTDKISTPQLGITKDGPTGVFPVADRRPSPPVRGETLTPGSIDVADLRGKVVVVNFWASWCSPCRAESANLTAVLAQTASQGVAFVGVDIKDERSSAVRFDRVHQVTYPSIFDQAGIVLTRFRELVPQVPPTTIVLDRQGRVAARFTGALTQDELLGPVLALAAERA